MQACIDFFFALALLKSVVANAVKKDFVQDFYVFVVQLLLYTCMCNSCLQL